MKCVNHDRCGGDVDLESRNTYWEATVAIRDRDGGGPNRRSLRKTGRGWCPDCSLRLEYGLVADEQEALF